MLDKIFHTFLYYVTVSWVYKEIPEAWLKLSAFALAFSALDFFIFMIALMLLSCL